MPTRALRELLQISVERSEDGGAGESQIARGFFSET